MHRAFIRFHSFLWTVSFPRKITSAFWNWFSIIFTCIPLPLSLHQIVSERPGLTFLPDGEKTTATAANSNDGGPIIALFNAFSGFGILRPKLPNECYHYHHHYYYNLAPKSAHHRPPPPPFHTVPAQSTTKTIFLLLVHLPGHLSGSLVFFISPCWEKILCLLLLCRTPWLTIVGAGSGTVWNLKLLMWREKHE